MAKDGIGILMAVLLPTVLFSIISMINYSHTIIILAGFGWLFSFFTVYFFRDPDRSIPNDENVILSPGDGKVVQIIEVEENTYLQSKARQVSIFLSVFDVHINRIPISGKVGYFNYLKGKFVQAFRPEASVVNEQTIIGIENGNCKILFKQIAGILARRIVCNIREGFVVERGKRFGMIKFGSRVDVLMPLDVEIMVTKNQKVKGGETVLGRYSTQ